MIIAQRLRTLVKDLRHLQPCLVALLVLPLTTKERHRRSYNTDTSQTETGTEPCAKHGRLFELHI